MEKVSVIIVAGGSGKRMGMSIKKQYILLEEKEVLAHTIEAFEACTFIDEIIVVVSEEEIEATKVNIINKYGYTKIKQVVAGGKERQDSVYNGLINTAQDSKYVMIHDGARPFIERDTISKVLEAVKQNKACVVAVPVKDTIKVVNNESKEIKHTPKRETLWSVQTPQCFEKDMLLAAYDFAHEKKLAVTDDSMLIEAYGKKVYIVEGAYTNIKITTKDDLILGKAILEASRLEENN
ncbi:2-C-methyl-D-erythritol 4-phosphate cytidylyltransferase [Cellulosilyticum ruminicola]|uniref:2-C-methyl-D-erythritol 4-phosphate cytidylyltransferase n=1 Tax=Cellulosilyticum ruminicola TaxID=425254 RepID=UPI0006D2645F|nr:2-C-methyl-D-erythritol 4-phosphate cytidylyltransferase [Cellulosilyticum ruminicola]